MIFYMIPILIGFFLSFYKGKNIIRNQSDIMRNMYLLLCALIFCGGYMTGSDWPAYEKLYEEAEWSDLGLLKREHGFYILMMLFKQIGFSFFPFIILCKFFVFYIIINFISKYSNNFYFSFSVFLASNALFIFVDNPLRFMISFGIIVYALRFLIDRKFLLYFTFLALAFTFHISSSIMIILYFVPNLIITNKKSIAISIYLLIFILFTPQLLGDFIKENITLFSLYTEHYIDNIQDNEINLFSIGRLVSVLFFIIIVLNREVLINFNEHGKLIYKFTIMYFYISLLATTPAFFRLSIFLVPFFYISISFLFFSKNKFKLIINNFIILYFLFSPINQMYSTFTYIPYSNYFISLFEPEKSYQYRINHNKIKYLERTGKWPNE